MTSEPIIVTQHLFHTYQSGVISKEALIDINLEIASGSCVAVIGVTGSGKSTLIQHFNGLLRPTKGTVLVDGIDVGMRGVDLRVMRQRVGMLFQFPEGQLFERTVFADVAFGPQRMKLGRHEIRTRVIAALDTVGLPYHEYGSRSPFDLSGGQRRRVALAGVLAMLPHILILDEPTVGLDADGRTEFYTYLRRVQEVQGVTIILVSHDMAEVASLADQLFVLHEGRLVLQGTPRSIFTESAHLRQCGLVSPPLGELLSLLRARGLAIPAETFTLEEAFLWLRDRLNVPHISQKSSLMIFRSIPLGVYYPGNSLVHRLQSRTKLLLIVWLIVWLVLASHREWHFVPFIVLVVVVGVSIASARISPREIWRRTWLIVIFFLLGLGPTLPTTDVDPRQLYTLGPFITRYGFARTALLILASVLTLFFLSSLLPALCVFWRRGWLKFLRIMILLAALVAFALFWLIAGNPATQSLLIGPYVITYGGTWTFMSSFLVLMSLLIFALVLTMTTSPVALIEGVTLLLSPLRRLKLPVDDFALMALLALRFIPTLVDETEQLIKAQSARGADLANGTMLERLHSLSMLFVPLMQGSLRRASDLATALEARGYKVDGKQTMLHETTFGRVDFVVAGIVVVMTVGSLLFR